MRITKEIDPFTWLCENSWCCGDLSKIILENDKVDEFNSVVEEYFNGQFPSECELNDFCRFNQDEIQTWLGIEHA